MIKEGVTTAALRTAGVVHGDTVALLLNDRPEVDWIATAARHLGAATVALPPASSPRELRLAIDDSCARLLITDMAHQDRITALRWDCLGLHRIVSVDGAADGIGSLPPLSG